MKNVTSKITMILKTVGEGRSGGDHSIRPDFYYYLFLEENNKIKIKIYFGAFPMSSSFPALHHKYFRCQVYFSQDS
jgi:hypothetical protein